MSDPRPALVLHVPGASEPLMFAVSDAQAETLRGELDQFVALGKTKTLALANESTVIVNFAHVVTAHIDVVPRLASVYGTPPRKNE